MAFAFQHAGIWDNDPNGGTHVPQTHIPMGIPIGIPQYGKKVEDAIPVYVFEGGHLDGSKDSFWDLCDRNAGKGLPGHQPLFEARADFSLGFSFSAEIQWDCVRQWSRIFDFGKDAGSTNILALNWERDAKMGMVVCSDASKLGYSPDFKVDWGRGEIAGVHLYPECARPTVGTTSQWLWTVDGLTGRISIYKDGHLVGEKRIVNYDPSDNDRSKFLIGKSWWKIIHDHPNDNFKGSITNIKIWDRCVTWDATNMKIGQLPQMQVAESLKCAKPLSAPRQCTMKGIVGIKPNVDERIMIRLDGWSFEDWASACDEALPPQLSIKGLDDRTWMNMMYSLQSTQRRACMVPCFPVYVIYLIIFVLTIGRILVFPLLVAALLPLGWFFDVHQMFLRLWLYRSNKKLATLGIYVKFQNIKRDFDEEKYVMFAFTPSEIEKLKHEPIFQRGMGLYKQERGSARPCPIDSHRVL